ncbi:spore germination protein (amino acid permease) [Paenibacillus endophyticus]|uniref:Spore germination protein (Amino acid permease) n=1 Tax=Paenibacillus endophyticus TaxID=1294268 RepID=A0A7W5C682_9BACL|nr:GerAB/ArcD/ProY family transporter [Paenibacillus endophyticus]MBB3151895.1 spore germination protein (amino acid permease) [Paenibacillus endophyticus]
MGKQVKESLTVSPYLLWTLIHGTQMGSTLLIFQSRIINGAEMDSLFSFAAVGLSLHLIIAMMFYLLSHSTEGDIISLHNQLFGKWVGSLMTFVFYGYILLFIVNELRPYIEVIHVWVFPYTPLWSLSILFLLVASYIVSGGLRVITGICFFCVIIPSLLIPSLYFPLKQAHWTNFLPLFNHNAHQFAESAYHSLTTMLGVEFLLLLYPFIKNQEKSKKWAHIAVAHSTLIPLIIAFVSFSYFNIQELQHTIWPTLILSKIIRFPFLERFDYIYIFIWFFVIISACCVGLWGAIRILKKTIGIKSRPSLWITGGLVFVIMLPMKNPMMIEKLDSVLTLSGWILLYGYIPLLCAWMSLRRWFANKKSMHNEN